MKSKVNIFLIVLILCFKLYTTLPTFGDEFVHIKVHIPSEVGESYVHHAHEPPIHAHSIVHAPVISTPYKVIHHFHHKRRRPAKKPSSFGKHNELLESILLSEIKEPTESHHTKYLNHAEDFAQHAEHTKPHIETYKFIEETKPKQKVETFKVIEKKIPYSHLGSYHHYQHDYQPTYHYKSSNPAETYKVIDSLIDDYHTNVKETGYHYLPPTKKQHVETVKIIDSHKYRPTTFDDYNAHKHDYATHDGDHIYAGKSQSETVNIIETKAPHKSTHELSVNFEKRPHHETVEIVQKKTPLKSSSYYHKRHQQYFDDSYKTHHYQHVHSTKSSTSNDNDDDDDIYTAGYEYKAPKYQDTYSTITDEHYKQAPLEDSYLPAKHSSNTYHHEEQQSQKSLYDDEAHSISNPTDSYLPPPPPVIPELDGESPDESNSYYSTHENGSKATETYAGIDSYSAAHVQGLGSGGYQYPSPYL